MCRRAGYGGADLMFRMEAHAAAVKVVLSPPGQPPIAPRRSWSMVTGLGARGGGSGKRWGASAWVEWARQAPSAALAVGLGGLIVLARVALQGLLGAGSPFILAWP